MIIQVLHCPYCQGSDIVKHGLSPEGKQRYRCRPCLEGRGRTFLLDYSYAGQSPAVKQQIVDRAMNASGIRDTARVLHVSPTTVINELKKTRVAKSAGVSSSQASRDRILDHGESADAGFVADGESPVPAAALARH
jgi:transposase-like protein